MKLVSLQLENFRGFSEFTTIDLNELSKEERFSYVPEMLCVNKDQICLVLYEED